MNDEPRYSIRAEYTHTIVIGADGHAIPPLQLAQRLSDLEAVRDALVAACGLALHKIEQTLDGQYPDGAALRAALHKIEQTLDGQYPDGAALRAALDPLRAALAKAHANV